MNESGRGYFRSGNYAAAAANFSRATLDDPSNPNYAYNLGKTLHKQGQVAAAEHQYRRALAIDPRHQPSYNGLASLMQENGRDAEATGLLSSWAATQPHLPAAHIELAALRKKQGDFTSAEASLKQALATDPGNTIALAHMGELKQQAGNTNEAAAFYRQSLSKDPFQKRVGSRLAAISQPTQPVVRQASYAPAPQMIAGRPNPSFYPQQIPSQKADRYATPRTVPTSLASSLNSFFGGWTPAGYPRSQPVAPGTYGTMQSFNGQSFNGPTPAMVAGTPQSFTTPGQGATSGHVPSFGTQVTYQLPTGPQGLSAAQTSGVRPLETPLPVPQPLAAPSTEVSSPSPSVVPSSYSTLSAPTPLVAPIQQINYLPPPTVPAF